MPELPEVETVCRDLDRMVKGLTICDVKINDPRVIRQDRAAFLKAVGGKKIIAVRRRGKALILDLDGSLLIVQLMMTGQLVVFPLEKKPVLARDARVVFGLSKNTTLVYNDQRLFGRLEVVRALEDHAHVRTLGPEPLGKDFSVERFFLALHARKTPIKPFLLDHRLVAGIGNIYASEILFKAGIRPDRRACDLKKSEVKRLHQAVRSVLAKAVALRGTSMRNYRDGQGQEGKYQKVIKVYGRDGKPCVSCGAMILKKVQSQRSSFFCGKCQQ
ncbi:MAG: bifunctional DNA-formamidopyrimidine glycosylase/DNA-(apurinic or apyrimidinic site) lyase [Candidatus Omnitrophica bacterium]|nr:bifunctional DNA-formamidopyrimidine glycosylase/DNA-(apurinic or apyrimidinic site) lyase [Candidatus Omnitrophota bacterium]